MKVDLLDKGYVILQDTMGTDLTPINVARASFLKKSSEWADKDERLMKYLVDNGHMSP